jgi:hypothetical protein
MKGERQGRGAATTLNLHDFSQVRGQRRRYEPTHLVQDLLQVVPAEREFAEIGEHALSSKCYVPKPISEPFGRRSERPERPSSRPH